MKNQIDQLEQRRKEVSIRHMHFNRFLLIRYATALFLFLNLYWAIFLLASYPIVAVVPLALLLLAIAVAVEQVKRYRHCQSALPQAKRFYRSQLVVNIVLMALIYTPAFHYVYPFLMATEEVRLVILIALMVGAALSLLLLRRIAKIENDEDAHLRRVKAYEAVVRQNEQP